MEISKANLNSSGQLVGFRLHDTTLIEFSYRSGEELLLRAVRADGSVASIRGKGVGILGTVKLQLPASIAEVFAWPPHETPEGTRVLGDGAWNVLFAQDVAAKDLPAAIRNALAKHEAKYLFHVDCSFGGLLSALCEEIFVE